MGNVSSLHQFREDHSSIRRRLRKMAKRRSGNATKGPRGDPNQPMHGRSDDSMGYAENHMRACQEFLLELFPDICPTYLDRLVQEQGYDHEQIAQKIMDEAEAGSQYPRRPRLILKRKRQDDDKDNDAKNAEATRRFASNDRKKSPKRIAYINTAKKLLQHAFPTVHHRDLGAALGKMGSASGRRFSPSKHSSTKGTRRSSRLNTNNPNKETTTPKTPKTGSSTQSRPPPTMTRGRPWRS